VVQTGEATALAVATGRRTVFGAAAAALAEEEGPSPFQKDLRALGYLIARATAVLALAVFAANLMLGRPLMAALLFSVALAVGLTPELLPMITTVTLSRGAMRLAAKKVIVKRLAAIHDLGAMTVLCTDKTGTLTSAQVVLDRSLGPDGAAAPRAAELASICADLAGDRGTLDGALIAAHPGSSDGWSLLGRLGFDYQRRMGAVLAQGPDGPLLVVKGAPEGVLAACVSGRFADGPRPLDAADRARLAALVTSLAEQGLRAVAVASRVWAEPARGLDPKDEAGLLLEGFCCFADPPKASAPAAVARLAQGGVRVVILSGDDPVVVRRLAGLVGLNAARVLTGDDIRSLSADALAVQARSVDAYARLTPDQKVRIVRALKIGGAVVGFLGDGVNDAPGLKAADIGLSVDGATGVARAAADMILLDSDLAVVADGVEEGRRTFVNILKYVRMGSSSNFGNMLSMAAASPFLPFLPMTAIQVLLNNLIYDISEIGIPFDRVSAAAVAKPQRWRLGQVARYALIMGPLSSVFDLITFGGLLFLFHANAPTFRTAWFLESISTQILVIFLIRTRGRPWRDLPHPLLAASTLGALAVGLILPFSPAAGVLGFTTLPATVLASLAGVVAAYLVCAEALKRLAAEVA
jgi:Mg2+-importing ATPase